ncbi:dynein heavy chain domain-containing protein 1 isoform X3 [Alligator mississippiensis]|uniref:dynein heavy chain domain-containing protein 1 isoform X3 n=1 Tax=Alligator mississippiensis TaxID=8496 RepID=UPI00287774CD|nr:dynein heavy chain domain-containing protein 1 isoform X3 [Alligator mississippiensis]
MEPPDGAGSPGPSRPRPGSPRAAPPRTGVQTAEAMVRDKPLGRTEVAYLNVAAGRHYRPYSLAAVPKARAAPQHYVFSPFGVLHVQPGQGAEALALGAWHREAVLWGLLRGIPVFRRCLLRAAFARWQRGTRCLRMQQRQAVLGARLLQAVPHFGAALLHISRLLQELRSVHWLPQDNTRSFSFPELQRALVQEKSHARGLLARFLTLYTTILELVSPAWPAAHPSSPVWRGMARHAPSMGAAPPAAPPLVQWGRQAGGIGGASARPSNMGPPWQVRNDTYRMARGLQRGTQVCGRPQAGGSAHQQRLQSEGMQRWHREAERWLGQLGSLARLVNLLVAQSLVSVVQDQVAAFVSHVMQADGARREAVLRVQLVFDADNQLAPFPSRQALEDSLLGALDAVLESVLEVCQTRKEQPGSLPESSASEAGMAPGLDPLTGACPHPAAAPGLSGVLPCPGPVPAPSCSRGATPVPATGGSHCPPCTALWEAGKGSMGTPVQLLPSLWDEVLGTQEQALRQPLAGLEVTGRRVHGHYPEPAWEQLEQDLRTNSRIQGARATQQAQLAAALDETRELCREHAWVAEVHTFVQGWSPTALEVMRGQPPSTYAEHVAQLRAWARRLQDLPPAVVTRNRLFLVDCSSLQQETAPLLASITNELQALALHEASLRSKVLITELSTVLKLYRSVGSDILTVAKCSHKVRPQPGHRDAPRGRGGGSSDTHLANREASAPVADEQMPPQLQQYQGQMGELQERVEYVRSLNDVIRHCFRPLAPDEENQENALLDTWEAFVFQQQEASDFITLRRLSIVDELEESLQRARQELHDLLAAATTGRFQDPASNAHAAEQDLRALLLRFQATAARLDELCHSQKTLTGDCMDQAFVATGQDLIEAHERLWRLFRTVTEQLVEWRCLAFAKFSAGLALERAAEWQREASRLEERLPDAHPVLQACTRAIGAFQQVLPLLQALGSPLLTAACWREIFAAMGVKCPAIAQLTLGQLLSYPLLEHRDTIFKVWSNEQGRWHTTDTLRRLQKTWAEKQLRVVNFILHVPYQAPEHAHRPREPARVEHVPKDSGTFVLSDTTELRALAEKSLLRLQSIVLSPHATDVRDEAETLATTLQTFAAVLDAWVSFQQKWVFLNIVLYEMDISLPSSETEGLFKRQDAWFRELMQATCEDPLALSCVVPPLGSRRLSQLAGPALQVALSAGARDLQAVVQALDYVLEATRMGCPRLFFLSSAEVVAMLASPAEPPAATAWARRCFPGLHGLLFRPPARAAPPPAPAPPPEAAGLVGACGETVLLRPPLPLQGQKPAQWLQALERGMKAALFQLLQGCVVQRLALRAQLDVPFEQLPGPTQLPLHLLAEHWGRLAGSFPAQCVLLAEEAAWRADVEDRLLGPGPRARPSLELKLRLKLEALAHYARSARASQARRSGGAQLCAVLGALLTAATHHRDVLARLLERRAASPAAFEWAQLLKYRVALPPAQAPGPAWAGEAPGCWAEVLDQRLHYDYEYVGPAARPVGGPQLERSFLGLLLALDEFRCAAVLGRRATGRTETVRGLARALGRQLVTLPCSRQLGLDCLRRFVSGAVQAGAWLLLEELDQLAPGVLAGFGQLTADLQALCLALREGPCSVEEDEDLEEEAEEEKGTSPGDAPEAPALPELGVDEAQPFQPCILGHILFGDRLLRVRETFGCLATLRQVPTTMRLALRPVALLPPDTQAVAELALLAAGFREASRLAHKLATFFRLEGELGPGPGPGRLALLKGVVETATGILHPPVPPSTSCAQLSALAGLSEEPALVRALCLSPLLAGPEGPRLAQLRELLRSVFPIAGSTLPECQAPSPVMRAVLAELQVDGLHADLDLAGAVAQLHQALQGSASVLLVGPVGSGKTTAWRTLAKALSRLATSEALEAPSGDSRPRGREDVALLPVSATCLCPNALSAPEFLGSMDGSVWTDGIFSRLMQRAVASGPAPSSQQWLVLDGAASPEWLEPIATLLGPEPALVLPSGRRIQAPEGVKLLLELPDASSLSPAMSTRCTLLHVGGVGLWQALLAAALASCSPARGLDPEDLALLRGLAEGLFPPTLAFLQQHCSSVLQSHAQPCRPTAWGVPETAAFARILQAQLDRHLPPEQSTGQAPSMDEVTGRKDSSPTLAPSSSSSLSQHLDQLVATQRHQLLLSIFVFAYIWGFGGHLHPRYWDVFDRFARRALLSSRCSVELPPAASVFDLYPQPESGRLEAFNGTYLSHRPKGVPATFIPLPQHERLLYLVDLLLGARQPVLLAGEPGAGKSALAELLAQPHQPWQRMALSPPFGATHLRQLLQTRVLSSSRAPGPRAPSLHGTRGHLLVLEDLHAAEPGPRGGSCAVLETLRQALSHREVCSTETLELQRLLPGRCLATLSAPAPGAPPLCPRLAWLFSTLALPTLTRDALTTMHTPALLAWLERLPHVPQAGELAPALVGATADAYEAVRARFRPVPARCPCFFSAHHIDKVLRGLLLLRPSPSLPLLAGPTDEGRAARRGSPGLSASPTMGAHTVPRLWLHEALRTFCDPLASAPEQRECTQLLLDTALGAFCAHRSIPHAVSTAEQDPGARPTGPTDEEDGEDDAPSDSDTEPNDTPSSSDSEGPDAFDPVELAPPLVLDPPGAGSDDLPAVVEPETKEPVAMPRLQVPSRLQVASWQSCPRLLLRCRSTEPFVGQELRSSMRRHSRRRSSAFRDGLRPLLPAHQLLLPNEDPCDLVFSWEPVPGVLGAEPPGSYLERRWEALQPQLRALLPPGFALCREVAQHLLRLLRVLGGPEQHGALVALRPGAGRRALARVAAQAVGARVWELGPGAAEEEVRAQLREACWQAGALGRRAVLLALPGAALGTLRQALAVAREGTCPGLHGPEDTVSIAAALLRDSQNQTRGLRTEATIQRFCQLVRSRLHVLVLLDGRRGLARRRGPFGLPVAAAAALLAQSCSIDVYQPWSRQSLAQVATEHLQEALAHQPPCTPVPASLRTLETSVSSVAAGAALIHVSARCHAAYLAPRLPLVTPTTFLDLLDAFVTLSTQMQAQTQAQAYRLRAVLDKLQEVSERQQARGQDVRVLEEKLRKAKEKVVRCRRRAEQEEAVRRQHEQDCQQRQARLEDLAAEHSRLEQAQEEALEKMGIDYEAALARLHVGDVEELRSYRRPPVPVVRVTDLLCRMFQQAPGWDSARQLLGRPDFYQELLFYPKDELSEEVQEALGHAAADPTFLDPVLRGASRAAAALGQWMCAVQRYGQARRTWQPVLQQLARCEQQIRDEEGQLSNRLLQAERLQERSAAWALKLEQVLEQQEALARQLHCAQQDQAEGDSVGCTMAAHMARWLEAAQALERMCSTVQGDALLCAAAVCYLGAFPPPRRQELLEKWQDLLAGRRVPLGPDDMRRALEQELPCPGPAPTTPGPPLLPVHPDFSLLALLSCEREQRAWDRDRKPQDPASRQAAALLHAAARICPRRWPLLLDPDQQALTWLSTVPRAKDDEACANPDMRLETAEPSSAAEPPEQTLQVLSAMDPGLEESLRAAAGSGLPVLLLHAEKSPGSPILQRLLQKEAGPELAPGEAVQMLPSFRLYLSTSLPLHTLGQEMERALLPSLNVVDLSLGEGALEELLLEELLLVECHEAQSHWRRLELSVLQVEDELACAEEELIQLISAPEQALLETEAFLPMVQLLDTQVEMLRSSHEHLCSLRRGHRAIREQYRPAARLGAALHQALRQVCRLHPLYRCSATAGLAAARRGLLVTRWGGTRRQEALEARVMELRRALARALLTYAQPGLWERHELLLALLGAVALQRLDGHVSSLAWLAFCQGLRAPTATRLLPLPPGAPPCPAWVDAKAWEECGRLEALPGFQGLQAALAGKAAAWQEYLRLPCTMVGPAPAPSHAGLGSFQRALLWRVLRPGQLCSVAADLAACLMGRPRAEAAAHSAATLYDHSQSHVPILFLTPLPGTAAATAHPLHWIQQMARQQHREVGAAGEGQPGGAQWVQLWVTPLRLPQGKVMVVTLGAPDCLQRVGEALGTCARRGHWLVLDNCHLQTHWPPAMLAPLQQLLGISQGPAKLAAVAAKGKKLHPKFRLWLIADARLPCPLPGALRQSVVTVCCETPIDLQGALLRVHSLAQDQQAWRVQPERGLPLLALHAALLHRQHYGRRAQAAHYFWTEAELFAGLRAQERLSQVVSNPEEALQELAGSIFYGGHILDVGDAAVVQTLSQQCLSQDPHLPPARGVQTLCAAVAGTTALGGSSEEQLADPQAQMQQLVGAAAPALCGLPDGLQEQELERRSQALLADLLRSQALWLPHPRLPHSGQHESLGPLVQQGLEMVRELEAALQQCLPCGLQCPPPRPLLRFLLDEAGNLAALLRQVGMDLRCTQQQLQGMPCAAPRCTAVLRALGRDRLPRVWLRHTPTGPQHPGAWLETLRSRGQLLCSYLGAGTGPPAPLYHLAAFQHPRRLLLALLQDTARAENQSLEQLHLSPQVLPSCVSRHSHRSGLLLGGLELRNAWWDEDMARLQATHSTQPCPLPLVWVQALRKASQLPGAGTLLPQYHCPIYVGLAQQPTCLKSHRAVLHLALPCAMPPALCMQHRLHIVSVLP